MDPKVLARQFAYQTLGIETGILDGEEGGKTEKAAQVFASKLTEGRRVYDPRDLIETYKGSQGTAQIPSPVSNVQPQPYGKMTKDQFAQLVILQARRYVGLFEKVQNTKWDNPTTPGLDPIALELATDLLTVGWQLGWAYCIAFQEMLFRKVAKANGLINTEKLYSGILNPSVIQSYDRAKAEGFISPTPSVGSIMFMRNGSSDLGHAELVTFSGVNTMQTIGANTSPQAGTPEDEREGDGIFAKSQNPKNNIPKGKGLWILGYMPIQLVDRL
jgi:hypothetical protein